MNRLYVYCFDFPVKQKNKAGLKIERKFGYKKLQSKTTLVHDNFWDCFKKTISTEEKDLLYCRENNLGIHVIHLDEVNDEEDAKYELKNLLKIYKGNKKQLSSENRKCRLELDENVKKFLQTEDSQLYMSVFLGYLAGLAVLALIGVAFRFWEPFYLFFLIFVLVLALGGIVGFGFLMWIVGGKMKDILYEKLGIETEDND